MTGSACAKRKNVQTAKRGLRLPEAAVLVGRIRAGAAPREQFDLLECVDLLEHGVHRGKPSEASRLGHSLLFGDGSVVVEPKRIQPTVFEAVPNDCHLLSPDVAAPF